MGENFVKEYQAHFFTEDWDEFSDDFDQWYGKLECDENGFLDGKFKITIEWVKDE